MTNKALRQRVADGQAIDPARAFMGTQTLDLGAFCNAVRRGNTIPSIPPETSREIPTTGLSEAPK